MLFILTSRLCLKELLRKNQLFLLSGWVALASKHDAYSIQFNNILSE